MCATLLEPAFERGVVLQNIRILARILMRLRKEAYLSSRSGRRMYKRVFVVLLRMRNVRDHFFSKPGLDSPHAVRYNTSMTTGPTFALLQNSFMK